MNFGAAGGICSCTLAVRKQSWSHMLGYIKKSVDGKILPSTESVDGNILPPTESVDGTILTSTNPIHGKCLLTTYHGQNLLMVICYRQLILVMVICYHQQQTLLMVIYDHQQVFPQHVTPRLLPQRQSTGTDASPRAKVHVNMWFPSTKA